MLPLSFQSCHFYCGAHRGYFSAQKSRRWQVTLEISSLWQRGISWEKAETAGFPSSRLTATRVFRILEEKSCLSIGVQYLSIISLVSCQLIIPPRACTKIFRRLTSSAPSSGSSYLLLQSLCPSVWTAVVTATSSWAMTICFPQALDSAPSYTAFLAALGPVLHNKQFLLHSIIFLTLEKKY